MIRFCIAWMVFLAAAALAQAGEVRNAEHWNGAQIDWRTFEDGLAEAARENRPVLIVFQTTWCPHCRRYRRQFYDPMVVEFSRFMTMVLVDRDFEQQTNDRYGAFGTYVPRTMVLNPRGELVPDLAGPYEEYPHNLDTDSPDDLVELMSAALAEFPE